MNPLLAAACRQLLLDWELGDGVTGIDVVRRVRPCQQNMRIVIVSGNERSLLDNQVSDELRSHGVSDDDWCMKPATADGVRRLIEALPAPSGMRASPNWECTIA